MHHLLKALCFLFLSLCFVNGELHCGDVNCPDNSAHCSLKFHIQPKPRVKVTTVFCYDFQRNLIHKDSFETPVNELEAPLPIVECGGLTCKSGAFNCSTVTTPNVTVDPPIEKTHLVCRDSDGSILEERDEVRVLSDSEANGTKPPSCEKYTCPVGSKSCTYQTIIQLNPYKKSTHVLCYDYKKKIMSDVTI